MAAVTKETVFNNLAWRFFERILAQLITTTVSIVLARILAPEDFGAVAIMMIFVNFCNIFVSKSFNSSLVQKKDADDTDFSTVFYINLLVTGILYCLLFIAAPFIAVFYELPILKPLIRVMSIRLVFTAVNSIQHSYVSRNLQFKKYFFSTLGGAVFSGMVGILMALSGCGAWALVGQYLTTTILNTFILFFTVHWKPKFLFSLNRAKTLFSYGWKILLSGLLEEFNLELRSFVIGKIYSPADLAYYNRGHQFPQLINTNVNTTITSVLFSVFSREQSDRELLVRHVRKSLKTITFVMFPLLLGLAAVSKEFILLLLTDKWIVAVPYMQIFCISYLFHPINSVNIQTVKALGYSGKYLKMTIINLIFSIVAIAATAPFGALWVCFSTVLIACFSAIIQAVPLKKHLNYSLWNEITDFLPNLLLSLAMVAVVFSVELLSLGVFATLIIKIAVGIIFYLGCATLLHFESFSFILSLVRSKLKK